LLSTPKEGRAFEPPARGEASPPVAYSISFVAPNLRRAEPADLSNPFVSILPEASVLLLNMEAPPLRRATLSAPRFSLSPDSRS
jgi:hypothetical protein